MHTELRDPYVLARRDLVPGGEHGDDPGRPIGAVRCGRPLFYPVPAADLPLPLRRRAAVSGRSYLGALFAFDVDAPPPGRRHASVRFAVSLTTPGAVAVQLDRDGDGIGVSSGEPASATAAHTVAAAAARPGWLHRLTGRRDTPRPWVTGALGPRFAWVYADPAGMLPRRRAYGMHALLEVPGDVARVAGAIAVEAQVAAGRERRGAALPEPVPFAEPPASADLPPGAGVRLCVAAGVAGHSRGTATHERIQARIVDVLDRACRAAGPGPAAVRPQPRGDGQFAVLPAGIDEPVVLPGLVQGLAGALRETNRDVAGDRLRLRLALHRCPVKEGANGWTGEAPIALHRLLDSGPVRAALTAHIAADHVLAVPDVLYRDVIVHAVEPPLPDDFTPITVDLPDEGLLEHGWLHIGPEDER